MSKSFGEYLVLRRRITPRAVLHVLKKQMRNRPHLGELGVNRGWLDWGQVLGIVSLGEQLGMRFGEAAVYQGVLTDEQVGDLLREQEAATPSISEAILDLGIMDPDELVQEQTNFELSHQPVAPRKDA